MTHLDLAKSLHEPNETRIVLLVADGLGGLPLQPGGRTELETANTPHLDQAAREGVCGLSIPVLPGIAPGSGPGHLALFGYDPLEYQIGRGILEALGIGFAIGPNDIAVRGNFCTVDAQGRIIDRRAGRPSTERCVELVNKLRQIRIPGVEIFVEPVREHRFVVVLRGEGLGDEVNDTDPQQEGVPPLRAVGRPGSERTAELINQFIERAAALLRSEAPTNMITLRGFSRHPKIPTMQEIYGLKPVALAVYPMYKGLARLVGMDVVDGLKSLDDQLAALEQHWGKYDFFFLHYKYTDSTGEDGNFEVKVKAIENLDQAVPRIRALKPDVLIVTGDHSTPSKLRSHSWHPVPTLLVADTCRPDAVSAFGESACIHGGLGLFPAKYLMLLALAHARRLAKFGA
ncbi:MAG: 2,3-bisphosphoglycerate-independent phosphoglycerate mutase [Gemmatales bacterium]|nr:2,3-bisphosphoglycerate-independent phosphoglycerate mutase [Gemmatales bacterium]